MSQSTCQPAVMPLRTLLVALLLAGFGLWQGWQCTDGMLASPLSATTMTVAMAHADHAADMTAAATDTRTGPGAPAGMIGLCVSVLACLAAAFVLLISPSSLIARLKRLMTLLVSPALVPGHARPELTRLCISRT